MRECGHGEGVGHGGIGNHCIVQILAAGHDVRTTVRNMGCDNVLRVLRADRNSHVKRVVLTSSFAIVSTAESLLRLGLVEK